ncbi:RluA family pseudouridine synthase [Geopsychrobacter electrodiphilus]|uniref:RluA family pseudouridine synthase n=1 Tax=Geopsychrobacter electrodiphilus TaxID=225196 RepID=UPI00036260FD|nr:RNA pseudouridine synthase [Geopsychrobacter electrodiphilus]
MDHQHHGKRPPQKRGPRGLILLHEDKDLLVIDKPAGLLTVGTDRDKTRTAHYLLNDYVRKGNPKSRNRVYVVHRLDQDTSGLLLFAKSEQAKKFLQDNWEQTDKHYLAIVQGRLSEKEGLISSYLVENAAQRVYSISDAAQGKLGRTAFKVVQEGPGFSLLDVHLLTGRKHQIRVHFAENGHPVLGDKKYGRDDHPAKRLALHARSIAFIHPFHGRKMFFDTGMPDDFIRLFGVKNGKE